MRIKIQLLTVGCWLLFFAISGFQLSCKKPPTKTKAQVIQERLDDRLTRWRNGVNRNCKKSVMDAAIAIVDSTLLANARFQRDTSDIPAIPDRPEKPDFVAPKDSIPVKPILEEN